MSCHSEFRDSGLADPRCCEWANTIVSEHEDEAVTQLSYNLLSGCGAGTFTLLRRVNCPLSKLIIRRSVLSSMRCWPPMSSIPLSDHIQGWRIYCAERCRSKSLASFEFDNRLQLMQTTPPMFEGWWYSTLYFRWSVHTSASSSSGPSFQGLQALPQTWQG
jgi:hypothetical protein